MDAGIAAGVPVPVMVATAFENGAVASVRGRISAADVRDAVRKSVNHASVMRRDARRIVIGSGPFDKRWWSSGRSMPYSRFLAVSKGDAT